MRPQCTSVDQKQETLKGKITDTKHCVVFRLQLERGTNLAGKRKNENKKIH